jgi:replicative DNA helicase
MTLNKLSEYGHAFQVKVIALLLTDKKFLDNVSDILTADYFESKAHKWIIEYILKYYSLYHIYPTVEVLSAEVKKLREEALKISIIENLREAYESSQEDYEYVETEFFSFCKNQEIKNALLQSVELLNVGDYESITKMMTNALKSGVEKDPGHNYKEDIETRFREELQKKISFPWNIFNIITEGGIGGGDLGLFVAPPGVGKTTVVCNIAANAIKQGYNVLFFTLELTDIYIGKKIDAILSGYDFKELKKHREEIDEITKAIPGRLKIKRYYPKKASIETLEAYVRHLKNREGFIPDMIIIDYLDLLKVTKARKDLKQEIDDVYTDAKSMAGEMDIPVISPSQINRSGSKDDIVEGDKIAGSFDKIMIADFIVSLSRKRKDKIQGTGRFHILKSRLGPDGMTYSAQIDMSTGRIIISEIEYDESVIDMPQVEGNGGHFNSDEIKEMRSKFKKFEAV